MKSKKIYTAVILFPCIATIITMIITLFISVSSQYSSLTTYFYNCCAQYASTFELLQKKIDDTAAMLLENGNITNNLSILNYSDIGSELNAFLHSNRAMMEDIIIIDKNNTTYKTNNSRILSSINNFADFFSYTEARLIYRENLLNNHVNSNGELLYVSPIFDYQKNSVGIVVIQLNLDAFLSTINQNSDYPISIELSGNSFRRTFENKSYPKFTYSMEKGIPLEKSNLIITLRFSIISLYKSVIFTLLIFLLIFAALLTFVIFLSRCLRESIKSPIVEMEAQIKDYTDSISSSKHIKE